LPERHRAQVAKNSAVWFALLRSETSRRVQRRKGERLFEAMF
jgi:hypothetical protein